MFCLVPSTRFPSSQTTTSRKNQLAQTYRSMNYLEDTISTAGLHLSHFCHPWISMSLAIVFELVGTINTKASCGVTRLGPSVIMFASYLLCALFLALALDVTVSQRLDLGIAYATWSGIGTVAAAFAGIYLYGETLSRWQCVGIVMTLVGVTLVNVSQENQIEDANASMAVCNHNGIPISYGSMDKMAPVKTVYNETRKR